MSGDAAVAVGIAVLSAHTAAIIALAILLGRTRERLARLEEQSRQHEKRLNGVTTRAVA